MSLFKRSSTTVAPVIIVADEPGIPFEVELVVPATAPAPAPPTGQRWTLEVGVSPISARDAASGIRYTGGVCR